jgi:hypothetical protein
MVVAGDLFDFGTNERRLENATYFQGSSINKCMVSVCFGLASIADIPNYGRYQWDIVCASGGATSNTDIYCGSHFYCQHHSLSGCYETEANAGITVSPSVGNREQGTANYTAVAGVLFISPIPTSFQL